MTPTPELPPLPLRSCIVTNVGNDKSQRFMLSTALGVALAEQPHGSTLDLFSGAQLHAYASQHAESCTAPLRAEVARLRKFEKDVRHWVDEHHADHISAQSLATYITMTVSEFTVKAPEPTP